MGLGFKNYIQNESFEDVKYQSYRDLYEKTTLSKSDFISAMSKLYDMGNEEAIERAASMMADIQVEETIDRIFTKKAPSSSPQNKEKLALEIRKLKIDPDDKVNLIRGIEDGSAYDIESAINAKGKYNLKSMVNKSYPGADKLLRWLVEWDASPDSGKRGKASTELFFIIAGKNGRTPTKGDAIVNGTAVEIKSYKGSFNYEFTVNGQQNNGKVPRDAWVAEARKLYSKQKLMKNWYKGTPFGFVTAAVPVGGKKFSSPVNDNASPGKNATHLGATMNAFCSELQNSGMDWQAINAWILKTTSKVFSSKKYAGLCWNGKEFDTHAFLMVWNCCALDYYKKEEGFDVITCVNKSKLQCVTLSSGNDMWKMRKEIEPFAISNKLMPGQNSSVAAGSIK